MAIEIKDAKTNGGRMIEALTPVISEADRAAFQQLVNRNPSLVEELGKSALRQDEFSRLLDKVKAEEQTTQKWHGELTNWKKTADAELAEARQKLADEQAAFRAAANGGSNGGGATPPDTSKFVTREELERTRAEQQRYTDAYGAYMTTLGARHFQEFGEALDGDALLAHVRQHNTAIDRGGYESFVAEKRKAKQQASHESELKAAEERGAARARQELSALPYVSAGFEGAEGTLSGLAKGADGKSTAPSKSDAVAAATATYNDLMRRKMGA